MLQSGREEDLEGFVVPVACMLKQNIEICCTEGWKKLPNIFFTHWNAFYVCKTISDPNEYKKNFNKARKINHETYTTITLYYRVDYPTLEIIVV